MAAVPRLSSLTLVRHAHHVPAHIGGLAELTQLLLDFGGDSGTLVLPERRALAGLRSLLVLRVHGSESLHGGPGAVAELRGLSALAGLRALQALELHNVCFADLGWLAVSVLRGRAQHTCAGMPHAAALALSPTNAPLPTRLLQALTKLTRLNLAVRRALTPAQAAAAAAPGYVPFTPAEFDGGLRSLTQVWDVWRVVPAPELQLSGATFMPSHILRPPLPAAEHPGAARHGAERGAAQRGPAGAGDARARRQLAAEPAAVGTLPSLPPHSVR